MVPAERGEAGEKSSRLRNHSRGALNQRLDHQRRQLASFAREQRFGRFQTGSAAVAFALPSVTVRRGDAFGLEQEAPEDVVEELDAADGHRANRIAVVGLVEGDELPLLR